MSKLTLMLLPDSTWAAAYNDEEAHGVLGSNNEERLFNAAMIWGLDLDGIEAEILDNREVAYPLEDYIKVFYGGNKSAFARQQGTTRQQVNDWLGKGFIVMKETLFSPRRVLNPHGE